MKIKLYTWSLLLLTAFGGHAQAADKPVENWKKAYPVYYQQSDPQLKRALDLTDQMLADEIVRSKTSAFFNASMWAAQVLRRQPEQTDVWCTRLRPRHKQRIAILMSFADTPDSEKCLDSLGLTAEERREVASYRNVERILAQEVNPFTLDARWGSFYATGNPKYIHDIVDYLVAHADTFDSKPEKPTMEDAVRLMTFGAARWSLSSNMRQYTDINKLVGDYRNTLPADKRAKLDQALKNQK